MKNWKHWKWQCVVAAPFLPWLLMQHIDITYQTGLAFGWYTLAASMATFLLTGLMIGVFVAGFVELHKDDD